jgi:nucleotide-binding universal stress UspA family protein
MKILVGYSGTNVGRDLLEQAVRQAKAFNGEVHVVTSLYGGAMTELETIKTAEANLEKAKAFLDDKGIKNQTHLLVRGQHPGEDIVLFARENGVDEIIIAVKSRSKVGKILFGSTAQYVILKADCPVISVK